MINEIKANHVYGVELSLVPESGGSAETHQRLRFHIWQDSDSSLRDAIKAHQDELGVNFGDYRVITDVIDLGYNEPVKDKQPDSTNEKEIRLLVGMIEEINSAYNLAKQMLGDDREAIKNAFKLKDEDFEELRIGARLELADGGRGQVIVKIGDEQWTTLPGNYKVNIADELFSYVGRSSDKVRLVR